MPLSSKISTLWVFVMINIAFADIFGFMYPGTLTKITSGTVDGITITPMFLLVAALFVEIPILMIFLSRTLHRRANRMTNLVAVAITILFVIGGGSLTPIYVFFGTIEVIAMLYIAKLVWTWKQD